jgi:hypothetical protein
MLSQWPRVVWATTLQFPSNGAAIADGAEPIIAQAAARAIAQIRLPIMGIPLFGFVTSICPLNACAALLVNPTSPGTDAHRRAYRRLSQPTSAAAC